MTNLRSYVISFAESLRIEPRKRSEVLIEVESHLMDRSTELREQGLSPGEADNQAIEDFGDPSQLAGKFYSIHAPASQRETILAILPHLALAAMFGLHLWIDLVWVLTALAASLLIAAQAWRKDMPQWSYPWLGYAVLLPAITCALAISVVGVGFWSYMTGQGLPISFSLYGAVALWIPFSLAIVIKVARRAIQHDWIIVSLAALPLPFLTAWLYLLHWREGALLPNHVRALETDTTTATVFIGLAITTAAYMKVGNRHGRLFIMLIPAPVLIGAAVLKYQEYPGSLPTIVAIALTVAFLLVPMLLDPRNRNVFPALQDEDISILAEHYYGPTNPNNSRG